MSASDQAEPIEKSIRLWPCNPGIALSSVQTSLLNLYLDELVKWNRKINLTGLRSRQKMIHELLLDSLLPIPYLPVQGRFLDVGSGAGFPSIPLRICFSGPVFHLVEPILKKTNFLKQVIRLAGLKDIEVIRGRVEDLDGVIEGEGYNVVLSRGLSLDSQVLSCCAALLAKEALLFTFQGTSKQFHQERLVGEGKKHGFSLQESIPYTVPGVALPRRLVIFKKDR
ncbi:MAG TPA: 16S rRNA (guanine(527)-N(7))-methyltransferase RsmG [Deltaproteobacteria bacterium]|nr:16S rRNA (guanine(527)-N(7))-methyltransferase RsmG [Deltaproteobacteria bacterium]